MRELHDRLSHWLRWVEAGRRELIVTTRGRQIAKLTPMASPKPLEELRRAGLIAEPTAPRQSRRGRDRPVPKRPVADLVPEQRE